MGQTRAHDKGALPQADSLRLGPSGCCTVGARALDHLAETTETSSVSVRYSAYYCKFLRAVSYATAEFQRFSEENLDAIGMRYECERGMVGRAEIDVNVFSCHTEGNAESDGVVGCSRTNKTHSRTGFPADGTATFAFSRKKLRMHFSDQFVIEL